MTSGGVQNTRRHVEAVAPFLAAVTALVGDLDETERYRRLLLHIHDVVPYDAAAFLRLGPDGWLVPVAVVGLVPDTLGRRFRADDHPRLHQILSSPTPVKFPQASELPDPFDGLMLAVHSGAARVHACMGCALRVQGETLGLLAADALDPRAFDGIDAGALESFAAVLSLAFRAASLLAAVEASASRERSVSRQLTSEAHERVGSEFLGASTAAEQVRADIALLARSDLPVLISGETGVGKEVAARALHRQSARRDQPLIYLNCAALPESIAESELFGHTRGAFTGATDARPGKFEVANRGTLFLDEIGEMPLSLQPKLLRVLQTGEIQRVGSDAALFVDVRVIAATNRNLPAEVDAGRFRADLFHRLNVYPIAIPPLRERPADIGLLSGYFLDHVRIRLGLGPLRVTAQARDALRAYDWPGNVRELEHVLLRAALRAAAGKRGGSVAIGIEHLALDASQTPAGPSVEKAVPAIGGGTSLRAATDDYQRALIRQALAANGASWAAAARALGLDRGNLRRLAGRLGLRES